MDTDTHDGEIAQGETDGDESGKGDSSRATSEGIESLGGGYQEGELYYDSNGPTLHLGEWEELVDTLKSITESGNRLVVEVERGHLEYPVGSTEANILRDVLTGNIGRQIRILRTDLRDRPLVVEVDGAQTS
jgi:hypothetical protein